jgi:hypothetical protein
MALAEVARFASLSEAQVAASALQASGIGAVVIDQEPAAAMWREPYGRGGFRLCAPENEVVSARALLRGFDDEAERQAPPRDPFAGPPTLAERFTPLRLVLVALAFIAIAAFALWGRL